MRMLLIQTLPQPQSPAQERAAAAGAKHEFVDLTLDEDEAQGESRRECLTQFRLLSPGAILDSYRRGCALAAPSLAVDTHARCSLPECMRVFSMSIRHRC